MREHTYLYSKFCAVRQYCRTSGRNSPWLRYMQILMTVELSLGYETWTPIDWCNTLCDWLVSICVGDTLQWRHDGLDGFSNHQPHLCLLSRYFGRRSKKSSKLRVTGLCAGDSPGTGEFPAQMASNAENVSIRWRHHAYIVHWVWMNCNALWGYL